MTASGQPVTICYDAGSGLADQVGELYMPDGPGPHPVAVLIHGGFWRGTYSRDLMDDLAVDLANRGWAAWNIEYRRVGAGGGWPMTFEDVASALDHLVELAESHSLDLDRVVTIGHSAGGHLALWAGSRHRIPSGQPGADPRVRPRMVVGQAAVSDLVAAAREGIGGSAVPDLMGSSPLEYRDRYAAASPAALLPAGVTTLLVHGRDDDLVPLRQSEGYAAVARASGDMVELHAFGGGHFEHLDPDSDMWGAVVSRLEVIRWES